MLIDETICNKYLINIHKEMKFLHYVHPFIFTLLYWRLNTNAKWRKAARLWAMLRLEISNPLSTHNSKTNDLQVPNINIFKQNCTYLNLMMKLKAYLSTFTARMKGPGDGAIPSVSILIRPASSLSKCSDIFL